MQKLIFFITIKYIMPDNCSNCLYIYGDLLDREHFIEKCIGYEGDLDLNTIIPIKENSHSNNVEIKFWGTKWGCYETRVEEEDTYHKIYFQTAWNPYSENVHKEMSRLFPKLKFELLFVFAGCDDRYVQGSYKSEYFARLETVMFISNIQDCNLIKRHGCNICDENRKYYLKDKKYDELYQTSG